jgi:hypothetical protein
VATLVEPDTLIIGTREQHHPGNLLALAARVPPQTRFHLLLKYEDYRLPPHTGPVLIYSPVPWFPAAFTKAHGRAVAPVLQTQHLSVWRVASDGGG